MLRRALFALAMLCVCGCPPQDRPGSNTDANGTDSGSDTEFPTNTNDAPSTDPGEPIAVDCSECDELGNSLDAALCALDLCDESVIVDIEHRVPVRLLPEYTASDTMAAIERFGTLANDLVPRLNRSYLTLATGAVFSSVHDDKMDDGTILLTDPFDSNVGVRMRDVVELRLVLRAPPQARAIRFQYIFFSAEYDEYVGSPYNDKFYAILEAGSTNGGKPMVINFAQCRDPDTQIDFQGAACSHSTGNCCYIAVNSALSECCWADNCPAGPATTDISGTGYSCALNDASDSAHSGSSTGWLTTAWPVQPGELVALTFHLHDTQDSGADSQVLLDAVQFLREPDQGTYVVK